MEGETHQSNTGQGLGIAGFILGTISLVTALIPCVGLMALIPGTAGIILCIIGLSQATNSNSSKGLIIAGLVISVIATSVSASQGWFIKNIFHNEGPWIKDRIEKTFEEDFDDEFDDVVDEFTKEMEKELEELERDVDEEVESALDGLSPEEKGRRVGKAAGKAVKEFIKEVKDTIENKE